jgi:hypothetical protein
VASDHERCEIELCGFAWDEVDPSQIGRRIVRGADEIAELITSGLNADVRRSSEIWSPVEYAGHVRDVLLNIRDRLVVAVNEDNPLCKGLFGTPRIEMGLYAGDPAVIVAQEMKVAASLFVRTWDRIPDILRERTMVYGYPRVTNRNLRWVAAQALHEVEHHLSDIRVGLA